jgi:hypothetical protein
MMAIGKTFGYETSKLGWVRDTVIAAENALDHPDIDAAVQVLREHVKDPEASITGFDATLVKALKGKEDSVAILHGLTEYARYLNAREEGDKKFTTSMMLEVDGMSNGPMLFLLNFATNAVDKGPLLRQLRNAGWIYDETVQPVEQMLTHNANHDIYKTMSFAWYEALTARIKQLKQEGDTQGSINKIDAVTELVGALGDADGLVEQAMRALAKDPTMQLIFGAGQKGLIAHFVNHTIIKKGIYGQLTKISKMPTDTISGMADAKLALTKLNATVKILIGQNIVKIPKGKLSSSFKKSLLQVTLDHEATAKILTHVTDNHGVALKEGIKAVYGDAMEARGKVNNGLQLVTTYYNGILKVAFDKAKEAKHL